MLRLLCGFLAGLILLAPMMVGGAVAKSVDGAATTYYDDATDHFAKGDFQAALAKLKFFLRQDPDNLSALLLIGRTFLKLGDGMSAEFALRRAQEHGADNDLVVVPLARTLLKLKRYEEVLAVVSDLGRNPEIEAELQGVHGQAYLGQQNYPAAEQAFERSLSLDPEAVMSLIGLAKVHLARMDIESARYTVAEATAVAPENFLVWFVAAQIEVRAGDLRAALEHFEKSIQLEPQNVPSRMARAMTLLNLGRHEDAARDYEVLQARAPDNPNTVFVDALIKKGRNDQRGYKNALSKAEILIRKFDRSDLFKKLSLLYMAGMINFANGNYSEAEELLSEYIRQDKFDVRSRVVLGRHFVLSGQAVKALPLLRRGVELDPGNARLWRLIGMAKTQIKDFDAATEAFETAISLNPNDTSLQTDLAVSDFKNGNVEKATAGFEKVHAIDPNAVRPATLLTSIYLRQHKFAKALKVVRATVARNLDNPGLYNLMATAHLAMGDVAAARVSLGRAVELDPNFLSARRKLARIDVRSGRVDKAKARINSMLNLPGAGVQSLVDLAEIAVREGKLRDAVSFLKKAHRQAPKNVTVHLHLIEMMARSGDGNSALRQTKTLFAQQADNPRVIEKIGEMELRFGDKTVAAAKFRRLSSLTYNNADQYLRIARRQIQAVDLEGAHVSLMRGLVTNKSHIGVLKEIIMLESRLGLVDEALQRTETLSNIFPKRSIGPWLRGDVLAQRRHYKKAEFAYRAAFDRQPAGWLLVRIYNNRRDSGVTQPPLLELERWVNKYPKDIATRRALGDGYIDADRLAQALPIYELLAARTPNDPGVLNNLAWLYFETDDARALATAEAAYRLAPDVSNILDTYGWILVQDGQTIRGLELLRNAHARASRRPSIRYHLAVALNRLGRTKRARALLEELSNPANTGDIAEQARQELKLLERKGAR